MLPTKVQNCLLLGGFMVYLVMGALVFELLENDHYKKMEQETFTLKDEFFMNYTLLSPDEVEAFIQKLIVAVQSGIDPIGKNVDRHSSWDFATSFFFVGTMLSTIGYGNLCPLTADGQLFCVIFALVGIPFNLICLNRIGIFVSGVCEHCAEAVYGKGKEKTARNVFFFLVLGILVFLFLPALLFHLMEGWSYSEAIYFTFITLSTIGFGDYIIGRKHDRTYFQGYRLLASIWIIFGLAWISVLFDLVTSVMEPAEPNIKPATIKEEKK